MKKQLSIYPNAYDVGICNSIAIVIDNIIVKKNCVELNKYIKDAEDKVVRESNSIINSDEVKGFTELFNRLGLESQIPAGQRLINLIKKRGFKRHNNIVDAYNIVSALTASGLGMHDASLIGDIDVFRAFGEETIIPLFKKKEVKVNSGDLVYASGNKLLAWLGKQDVDSNEFKVTEHTTSLVLIALGNRATSKSYNKELCLKTFEYIKLTCPNAKYKFLDVVIK